MGIGRQFRTLVIIYLIGTFVIMMAAFTISVAQHDLRLKLVSKFLRVTTQRHMTQGIAKVTKMASLQMCMGANCIQLVRCDISDLNFHQDISLQMWNTISTPTAQHVKNSNAFWFIFWILSNVFPLVSRLGEIIIIWENPDAPFQKLLSNMSLFEARWSIRLFHLSNIWNNSVCKNISPLPVASNFLLLH